MGITYYVRGEFYREKARDYVSAAVSLGAKNRTIIFKHILPNSLTPIISFAPFAIVADISALVSLDFLGFGLPPPTPSWGQLVRQGMTNIENWWLVAVPLTAMFLTLIAIVFIGEAIREAFDPKVHSRLR
jgi:microcin C transport system permease protein